MTDTPKPTSATVTEMSECQSKCACGDICRRVDEHLQHQCPKCNYENVATAPDSPAATPLREANQQRVDAAAQRVRQTLDTSPSHLRNLSKEHLRKHQFAYHDYHIVCSCGWVSEGITGYTNAWEQWIDHALDKYPADDPFRKDVELLIEIALAPVLEIFAPAQPAATPMAWTPQVEVYRTELMRRFSNKLSMEEIADFSYWAAQPQREREQPEQALREAAEWIIRDAQYKAPEQIGLIAERWLERLRAALSPQTDSLSTQQGGPQHG